jgi:hypothetical protein
MSKSTNVRSEVTEIGRRKGERTQVVLRLTNAAAWQKWMADLRLELAVPVAKN